MPTMLKQQISYKNKTIKILTNQSDSKKMLIFFHGLDGSAASSKPLFQSFPEYKIVAVEQRGHMNSNFKASRLISTHLNDYLFIINHYYLQGYKIWIIGESMGAAYSALLGFKSLASSNQIAGIFAQSIPNKIVNVLKVPKKDSLKIKLMTMFTFFTNINYSYIATIDYEKFSSNKTLHRLARLADQNKKRQVREALSTWAANKRIWKYFKSKTPKVPIYYFQPTNDIASNMNKVDKAFAKQRQNLSLIKAQGAKHILMHEPAFKVVIECIRDIME